MNDLFGVRRWGLVALLASVFLLAAVAAANASHPMVQPDGDRMHWSDNDPSFPRGYVFWQDQTGAEWPVFSSAVQWDRASRLDAVYVTGSCTSNHCVTVREADLDPGCTGRLGEVLHVTGPAGHYFSATEVRIDAQCDARSAADRRELVCHELGHSTGLDDRPSNTNTCMRSGDMVGEQFPDGHDFEVLLFSYNHDDPG
ncbi:hypothetical protein [Nocardioides speluncae]|uniref:hypothetical protein n=1 Tax=Nocardioides speluncae TaxID=2670337 RepID=UPI0012B16169|nr:hypothetical protein [Nocardioides speluncae]